MCRERHHIELFDAISARRDGNGTTLLFDVRAGGSVGYQSNGKDSSEAKSHHLDPRRFKDGDN